MTKFRLSRRAAVTGLAAGGVVVAGGAGIAFAPSDRLIPSILRDILGRALPVDMLNEAAVAPFIEAYAPSLRRRLTWRARFKWLLDRVSPGELEITELLERDVVTSYLLGTDAFDPDRPKGRPLRFSGVSDACQNPFRRT